MAKTYDSGCYDLATAFLQDDPSISTNRAGLLAIEIQTTIEEWLERQKRPCDACGNPIGNGDHSDCNPF